jgi:NTP pyrophosphatase (non-canonical NTP hydrolase)
LLNAQATSAQIVFFLSARACREGREWVETGTLVAMDFAELQDVIDRTYGEMDRSRGVPATVAWLCEEVGELAQAVRKGTREQQVAEFADVIAWVATLANQVGIDLNEAAARYAAGCPKCAGLPCRC